MNAFHPGSPGAPPTLPQEHVADPCRLRDEFHTYYRPTSPIERHLIEQAIAASNDHQLCFRIRATMRTAKLRTAVLDWERAQEDEVEKSKAMFNVNPYAATIGLKRTAAGVRYMIERWERLETRLAADGTWYGCDRLEAIQLQGDSAMAEDLYFSEEAWMTWLDCLAAQPNPKQADIDLICRPTVVPKALQDRDFPLWPQDPEASRARLHALVARELPPLRILEGKLRVQYEEPSRAEAQDQALARVSKDETQLLREQRSHERSFQQATNALLKVQKQAARSAPRPGAVDQAYERLVAAPTLDEVAAAPEPPPSRENPPGKRRRIAPPFRPGTTASLWSAPATRPLSVSLPGV